MDPLLPAYRKGELADLTSEVFRKSGSLAAQIPSNVVRRRVASLVREMNSYYSNLIEGHKTLPRDIEKAMREDFSSNPEQRANQRLNKAHIEVEQLMVERLQKEPALLIHSAEFICWLHREFYSRVPAELHWSQNRSGEKYQIQPGVMRDFEVEVGQHQPPFHRSLPQFMQRFQEVYGSDTVVATDQLIALAAAHHRLAWIHPFGDGNGRVTRLYSHAWLVRTKVDSFGLWTLSRGLARDRDKYFQALSAADQKRWNDLDGRGNLSDRALSEFCVFILKTMVDQIDFMSGLFQFDVLSKRIDRYLQIERVDLRPREREALSKLLRAALIEGEIERGRAAEILGNSASAARLIVRLALDEGLLDSSSAKGPLALVFSAETLESYFPKLYSLG
ncbi:MAG TPA: Fic family protein [Verrucomicrobiae bacterium]|nr:Fic family protein [Verrucomicrobiae bacterium]